MSREVFFFDLETDTLRRDWPAERTFEDATLRMHMTVGCGAWGPAPGECPPAPVQCSPVTFWRYSGERHDMEALGAALDQARMIVMYNGARFDMRVLMKYYAPLRWARWQCKLFDPFLHIYAALQSMVSLNELAHYNGVAEKTQSGAEAPDMWRRGEHDTLERYCAHDVEILAAVLYHPGDTVVVPRKRYRDVLGTVRFPLAAHTRAKWRTIVGGVPAGGDRKRGWIDVVDDPPQCYWQREE